MRKIYAAGICAALIASLAGPSMAAQDRTLTKSYTISRGEVYSDDSGMWVGSQPESFKPRATEHHVIVSLTDQSGQPVRGRVEVAGNVVEFCSLTPNAITLPAGSTVTVSAIVGACGAPASVLTEGSIKATFSK